ncbi:T9SS type B sorting domain-containing protein [Maribacter sp. BPC-D8]|uniref:T9SS type B sorting domain-containing protein n=1 Tax=Maribacter sp. BPC-D8 TaxID=3053613 RepID=UPI002B47ED50|nr:T9SS type B sorting domain-containing protein [Maribacter sp. BPC-D8]WRI28371.1 T9SS type B sorting domain-containing protein [Maribacter sp. BPC-D8]
MRFCLLFFALTFVHLSQAQVTPAERAALLAFYNATDGPNWFSENDADTTDDWDFTGLVTDDWKGLTIFGGNVISINMNPNQLISEANNLTGTIPDEIGDFTSLRILNLAGENLSGNLPASLFDLTELSYLNLVANNLSGEIPGEISQLVNLVNLLLTGNNLDGEIPVSITTLNNLEAIELSANELTGEIPFELTNMLQLVTLKLGSNQLTGFIYPEYENLVNLETFYLFGNLLTGTIPPEIGNMTSLRFLNIGRNDLNGTLPDNLGNLSNLEFMDISSANISGSIPESFGDLTQLQSLRLYVNELTGTIPASLANLTQLRYFEVLNNNLSGELSPDFSNWTQLLTFKAGSNELTGTIPESYASFTNMTNFEISYNNFSGELSPLFSNWNNISFLNIRDNEFSGELPDTYSSWTNLEIFNIGHNQFSGQLSPDFANWTNAQGLNFQYNQFEGPVPDFTAVLTDEIQGEFIQINNNRFQFGDFEDEFDYYNQELFGFFYNDQAKVNDIETFDNCVGSSITLSTIVSGTENVYQWFKDGSPISGANDADLILDPLSVTDAGVYTCEITSTIVTDLTLERNPITVSVNDNAPTANEIDNITACDLDGDGFAVFPINLANLESQIIGSQTGLTVSYFDATGNLLALTDDFTNTIPNTQTVIVRVTNSSGCEDETSFNLTTTTPATAEQFDDTTACGSFTLPELDLGNNYYTQPDAEGTQLQPGENITTTQTIYIYAGVGDCSDQTNFTVSIEPLLTVDELDDITECGVFTLPQLNNGSYYTQSGGTGILMNSGEAITQTQTIFIYDENDTCFAESTFQVTIDFIACENSDEAIKLKFPNFFTPNEDGANDVWEVNQDFFTLEGTVTIYDRYGKLLYQFDAKNGGWNGTFNGRRLTATDYWYRFVEKEGNTIVTGHFSLII